MIPTLHNLYMPLARAPNVILVESNVIELASNCNNSECIFVLIRKIEEIIRIGCSVIDGQSTEQMISENINSGVLQS